MKIKLYQCGGERPKSEYALGIGYLKSNCKFDVKIVHEKKDLNNCDIIGLSSNAWGVSEAVDILNSCDIPIIIGGQATLWKDLEKYNFKYIVKGEGELSFNSILNGTENNKIVQKKNILNIDDLNFPERGECGKVIPILSSRGCPWSCHFCSSTKFWGKVRYHSPEYFITEVEYILKKYKKAEVLYILDDLFISDKKRFYKIYELWMKKEFNKKLKLSSFIRSNLFDIDIAKAMQKMGFVDVRFGAESGSNRILKILNKQATVEDHQKTIDICNLIGMNVRASFMYDIPGETEKDRILTRNFKIKNRGKLYQGGSYKFMPFPGTKFYNNQNLLKMDMRVRGGNIKIDMEQNVNEIKLDFGCGTKCKSGFQGVDIRLCKGVKYVCNAWEIDKHIMKKSVSEIFSRHFLEHLTFKQLKATLFSWKKILVPNGKIEIIVPDMDYHINQFLNMEWDDTAEFSRKCNNINHSLAGFWGWQRGAIKDVWDIHKSGYNFKLLKMKLEEHGFYDISRISDRPWNLHVTAKNFKDNKYDRIMV